MIEVSRPLRVVVMAIAFALSSSASASALGPGGWDHVGDGGLPSTSSLNGTVSAFHPVGSDELAVGGVFTNAGGNADADYIAGWTGSAWQAYGPSGSLNGGVEAIAYAGGKLFAGGVFTNAGGNANADFLAVYDGTSWQPFCNDTMGLAPFGGTVSALQVIGSTLWVGGSFQNGAHIPAADYLLACDLNTGVASSPYATDGDGGAIYDLTADTAGNLYAAGPFINLAHLTDGEVAAQSRDHVAYRDTGGAWHAMGSGPGPAFAAVTDITRSITSDGTNVYIGSDSDDIAGNVLADNVAKWDGATWSGMGSNTAATDGWFPASTFIYGLTMLGSDVVATGSFQNANGEPTADAIASFDGAAWHPIGSDGAGNGPINPQGNAVGVLHSQLFAGGSFTTAGGDPHASYISCYSQCTFPPPVTPPTTPAATPPAAAAATGKRAAALKRCKKKSGAARAKCKKKAKKLPV
jgi:hypothetical protein